MSAKMLDLNSLMLFHEVVRSGSLTAACERLGMPRSTLSRRLLQLEKDVGALLLKKSTRKLAPTDLGISVQQHCERIAAESAAIQQTISRIRTDLHGTLRVAMPIEFGTAWLGKAISDFAVKYPEMALEIDSSGRVVDLIDESVDILITFGHPKPSRMAMRRLGSLTSGIYAAPAYVARCGLPRALDELGRHDCVVTEIQLREGVWRFRNSSGKRDVQVNGRLRVNSIRLARELVIGGAGLGLLPHMMCANHVASGALVPVLPSWSSPSLPVVALMLSRTSVPKKTRTFLDFVAGELAAATS
ncbi:LysR family transcriptional regulator [Ramlibacter sp. AN1015]|uniref:LysR family transcriptional regulator n=1 Tax=Ramlibacter sp. AN1015 TaxID=3133428 RepID=UPI0030BED2C7